MVFEALGYFLGFRLFLLMRRRLGDPVPAYERTWVVVAAIVGAALGSKVLCWVQHPVETWAHRLDPAYLIQGKSIVGGLLGGLVAVEAAKRWLGVVRPTGDLFVLPLCVGMAIGRIGCFLSGVEDRTFGTATSLPWGVDFGDGVRRHPAQLYEIVFLAGVAMWAAWRLRAGGARDGSLFSGFMVLYLTFRLALEFIKPDPRIYLGLSGIQLACLAVLVYYTIHAVARRTHRAALPAIEARRVTHGG